MLVESDITNINIVVLLFILVISGNYIGELLPCRVQHQLQHNIYLKHFIGILTLSFFVILSLTNYKTLSNIKKLGLSFVLYIFFLGFAKTHYSVWFSLMILITLIYIFSLIKQDIENGKYKIFKNVTQQQNVNFIKKLNNIFSILSLIIVFFGVVVYYSEKHKEYKKKFSFLKFFIGKVTCKNNKVYKIF